MTTYTRELQRHLTLYKSSRLGVKEAGIYVHNGKEMHYGHILPRDLKWLNILEPCRSEVQEYLASHREIKLHKYFHHLNSSQAFALNLFFPFFEDGASSDLLHAMGLKGSISNWLPELVPCHKEETNVDISWQDSAGAWTYCEVKLSESEFGKAKDDKRHKEKLKKIYEPILKRHCRVELLEPKTFFANYQIMRNIWLAAKEPTSTVVFLLPARRESLWKPLRKITALLEPSLRKRIHLVEMEQVIDRLQNDKSVPARLSWYAQSLSEKYVVPVTGT